MPEPAQARLTIDLDALAHNHAVLKREAGGAEVAPVVKSDGYGLGAGPLARRLWADGARSFFVARLAEGEALRAELGPDRPAAIHVLDGLTTGAAPRFHAAGLTPVISSLPQAAAASVWARQAGRRWPITLHVDTGMNRQGLSTEETRALAQAPDGLRDLDVTLVMSHLGSASEPSDVRSAEQLERFRQILPLFPDSRASLAASAGLFLGEDYRFDVVRPGVSLYGGGPLERPDARLKAVATLTAPILDIRNLRPGDRLGYGSGVTADRPTRIAVVGAGYADGVIRAARRSGYAWLAGERRRLLIVTMDLLAIEIGDAEGQVGQPVELLGPNALLDDQAAAAGTVAHEVLVRLSRRAERVYLGGA
ncbi:alanine racemase [Phenylobacterium sp.]|uniref:alanine racemase n=1 Tax=Phenylobacterium sp. TaxID=1871053 RepID=UPI002B8877A1|nr:alanine racemase [Phenylobacterium sp.]HVI32964.1 alanine racemase [Phenylobacterium sp.]